MVKIFNFLLDGYVRDVDDGRSLMRWKSRRRRKIIILQILCLLLMMLLRNHKDFSVWSHLTILLTPLNWIFRFLSEIDA